MFEIFKNFDRSKFIESIKPFAIAAACMTVVFVSGFGAGKLQGGKLNPKTPNKRSVSTNYNTNVNSEANKNINTATTGLTTSSTDDCKTVKGSKSKIYHMPEGAFYERTKAAQCFVSEEEAIAAGYTKSSK